jgi:hypothetical protein
MVEVFGGGGASEWGFARRGAAMGGEVCVVDAGDYTAAF